MKKRLLLLSLIAGIMYVTLSSYSNDPWGGGIDGTGATGSSGCSCHGAAPSAAIADTIELDSVGVKVNHYVAGGSYTIKLKGVYTAGATGGSLPRFGFELTAVSLATYGTTGATNIGTLASTGLPASCFYSVGPPDMIDQSAAIPATTGTGGTGTTYVVSIPWTAPATGSGAAVLCGVINAVDFTGGTGGDKWHVARPDTVTEWPIATAPITGTLTVCAGSTTTLSDVTTGGTWTSGTVSVATVSSSGVVTGVAAGSSVITYSTVAGGPSYATVTVSALPGVIGGGGTVCVGATLSLTEGSTGGTWSSSSTSIATVSGTGVVTGVSAGSVTISYTNAAGCASTHAVTVNAMPVAGTITGSSAACIGTPSTLSDAVAGGTWTSSAPAIASVSATGVVTGLVAGSATITYTVTNSCGSAFATFGVTASAVPGTITGGASVCAGSTLSLSELSTGGVWSSSMPTVATVSATGVVTGLSSGTVTISYTNLAGCYSTHTVIVNPLPVAGTISGPSVACIGTSTSLVDGVAGGVWTSSAPTVASVSAAGVVTGVAAGAATISYAVTNPCGTVYATYNVTVNSTAPVALPITGPTTVCQGATIVLADPSSGGSWTSGSTSVATIDATGHVTGVSVGGVVMSYSVSTACSTAVATYNLTVQPGPTPAPITGVDSVCYPRTAPLADAVSGGLWTSDHALIATVDPTTGVVTPHSIGIDSIRYTISNTCGTATVSMGFKVSNAPTCYLGVGLLPGHDPGLSVYPNPSQGAFTLIHSSFVDENIQIEVTNLMGQKVMQLNGVTNKEIAIDLGSVTGVYFVTVISSEGRTTQKATINN